MESRIIKTAVGLNKYHSTTLLNAALDITPISQKIKINKLKFITRLSKYTTTKTILEDLNRNKMGTHHLSLTKEITALTKNSEWTDSEGLQRICENGVEELANIQNEFKATDTAEAIKYLLESKKPSYMNTVRRLLHWQHSKEVKRHAKRG